MSRSREDTLETQRHRFAGVGVLFEGKPFTILPVEVRGSKGMFSLSAWLEQETGYKILAAPHSGGSQVDPQPKFVTIDFDDAPTPEEFVMVLLHEMGHVALQHKEEPASQEKEQEAWQWAIGFLVRLREEAGWDIRTLPGFTRERMKQVVIQQSYALHFGSTVNTDVLGSVIDQFWDS